MERGIARQIVFFIDTQGMAWVCKRLSGKTGLFSEEKQTKLKTIRMVRIAFLSKQLLLSYNCPYPALLRLKEISSRISNWKKTNFLFCHKNKIHVYKQNFALRALQLPQGPPFHNDGTMININRKLDISELICCLGIFCDAKICVPNKKQFRVWFGKVSHLCYAQPESEFVCT